VLNGLRGVGKTALLNELLAQVSARGWITAKVESGADAPLAVALSQALVRGMRTATGRHPEPRLRHLLCVFKSFSITVDPTESVALGVDVDPVRGTADSGRLADDLAALFEVLGETARELGVGALVLIDEVQEASAAELAAVNTAVHQIGQGDAATSDTRRRRAAVPTGSAGGRHQLRRAAVRLPAHRPAGRGRGPGGADCAGTATRR
jgi:hypothetical protein